MSTVKVKIKGCTRLYVTRHGDVGAQRGLTSAHWIANDPVTGWLAMPLFVVRALWWIVFPD